MNIPFRIGLFIFLVATSTQRAAAMPLELGFSSLDFTKRVDVTGFMSGLANNNGTSQTSSALGISNTGGQGSNTGGQGSNTGRHDIGEYVGSPDMNVQGVNAAGQVTSVSLESVGFDNKKLDVTCCTQLFETREDGGVHAVRTSINYVNPENDGTDTPRATDIPNPSALFLIGLGLLGLSVSRRKRQLQH